MGRRHTGRKLAMQAVFQAEVQGGDIQYIIDSYIESGQFHAETKEWASELASGVWKHRDEADALVKEYAIGWDIFRINPVDLSLLRIAFYELLHLETPPSIILNEAIELAKKYSTDDSPKFVNGILGKYVEKECSLD
jgi:transcription antitermination protein NusB